MSTHFSCPPVKLPRCTWLGLGLGFGFGFGFGFGLGLGLGLGLGSARGAAQVHLVVELLRREIGRDRRTRGGGLWEIAVELLQRAEHLLALAVDVLVLTEGRVDEHAHHLDRTLVVRPGGGEQRQPPLGRTPSRAVLRPPQSVQAAAGGPLGFR